jgi:hypothetical protein
MSRPPLIPQSNVQHPMGDEDKRKDKNSKNCNGGMDLGNNNGFDMPGAPNENATSFENNLKPIIIEPNFTSAGFRIRFEDAMLSLGSITYATIASHNSAPNPLLSIDGVGNVGVPVGKEIVDTISEKYGDGFAVMTASKVSFRNALWDPWVQEGAKMAVKEITGLPAGSAGFEFGFFAGDGRKVGNLETYVMHYGPLYC